MSKAKGFISDPPSPQCPRLLKPLAGLLLAVCLGLGAVPAHSQFEDDDLVPPEGIYDNQRPQPGGAPNAAPRQQQQQPYGGPQQRQQPDGGPPARPDSARQGEPYGAEQQPQGAEQQPYGADGEQAQPQRQLSEQERYCLQLEQSLANDWVRADQGQTDLPRIDEEIRKFEQIHQSTQAAAERADCYQSLFIFGRSLRRTPRCTALNDKIEDARRQVDRLQEERNFITRGSSRRARQDELIDQLARNGCGDQYARESRRRQGIFSWFSNDRDFFEPRRGLETSRIVPYATYRTLCVRLCDGYYYPISYSTLPSHFSSDANACQSGCAAPAALYVYRNPGEEPEQMVSLQGKAYNDLETAWRYRKEYVKGCSCKVAEFNPDEIAKADGEEKSEAGTGGEEAQPAAAGPGDGKVAKEGVAPKAQ